MSEVTTQQATETDFDWLLEEFLKRVPGTAAALLTSRDGLVHAKARFSAEQADTMAAIVSGQYSLARGVGTVMNPDAPSAVRQTVAELDDYFLFCMSASLGLPPGADAPANEDPETVSTLLGVVTTADADVGLVGHESELLARSVGEHLVTPTRRGQ